MRLNKLKPKGWAVKEKQLLVKIVVDCLFKLPTEFYVISNNISILFIQLEKHANNWKDRFYLCTLAELLQTGNMTSSLCVFYIIIYYVRVRRRHLYYIVYRHYAVSMSNTFINQPTHRSNSNHIIFNIEVHLICIHF